MHVSKSGLLRGVGLAVGFAGLFALFVMVAPVLHGQSNNRRAFDFFQLQQGSLIGASLRDVDDADVKREKLSGVSGAVVEEVTSGGPAARAGFKAGDIVVSFDGENVRSAKHLTRLIEETPNGREVNATVVRAGERVNLKVAPEAAPGLFSFRQMQDLPRPVFTNVPERYTYSYRPQDFTFTNHANSVFDSFFFAGRNRLGADVQELTGQLNEYFGTTSGVLVTNVNDNTPAKTAGVKAGDVITKINGQAVTSPNDLRRALANATGEVTITVMRDRREQTLKTKMEDEPIERVIRRR